MSAIGRRDPAAVHAAMPVLRLATGVYHRAEVTGMEHVPDGGALIVSNHSGGIVAMDVPVLACAFEAQFGPERPLYCLAHDMLFFGWLGPVMRRYGFVPATRANALEILSSGAVTIVFPGGDWDAFRPTRHANTIDFNGRTGYVRTAIEAGVPIVPAVSIGGQESQVFLGRGERLGGLLGIDKIFRSKMFPISLGVPFGVTATFPPNLPLPTKIVSRVLEPVDPADYGADPDVPDDADVVTAIDAEVRRRMQVALDELAARRRFPVLG